MNAKELASQYTYTVFLDTKQNFAWYHAKCNEYGVEGYGSTPEKAFSNVVRLVETGLEPLLQNVPFSQRGRNFEKIMPTRAEIELQAKEKSFEETIFLGCGNWVCPKICLLHERINQALISLSGEQQNGGMGTEYEEQAAQEHKDFCLGVIWDVITAFGFKDSFVYLDKSEHVKV